MSSIVPVTETDERSPLLRNSYRYTGEITPFPSPSPDDPDAASSSTTPTDPKQRLVSLDVFRGLTIALMILVDDAGGAFPSINHSPWFGVTIADFAMPFFLFIVGISVSLVFKKISSKPAATKKVIVRTIKLFLLGLILQGGYFHGRDDLTYGVDITHIRWMGVLQRISIGYLLASITEIWCVNNNEVNSAIAFVKKYYIQWLVVFLLGILYMALLYGLYVPDWEFEVVNANSSLSVPNNGTETVIVHCGVRGSLEPPCNAVGLIDRFLLGESHLYQRPVYKRTEECSINSPDYGPLPPNAPAWCLAPFDPEGLLSSLMAAITCFLGLQYGHILVHYKGHMRIIIWMVSSSTLLVLGYVLTIIGVPLSKPLYTLSYMCITTGASGILLIATYYTADVINIRKPLVLFQWMGMNALIVYALAACDIFPAVLQGFYWRSPENNLVTATELLFETVLHSQKWVSRIIPSIGLNIGDSWCETSRMKVEQASETNTTTLTTSESESVHVSASASASASVTASPSSSTVASPSGKRSRDPEDEVYVDNLHSHKRYLSEIMASSLNGLSVGDPLHENLMDSPARSDTMFYLRDELSFQYSPMSEDLDECRYYDSNACSPSPSQPDSQPTSPVSPYRFQRLAATTFSPGPVYPGAPAVTPSQARQRGSEPEGRFPSSPSDICHSADLRRAALMRSVQMRTQPTGSSQLDAGFSPMQEVVQPCPYSKSLVQEVDNEYSIHEKSCRVLSMNMKGDDETTD